MLLEHSVVGHLVTCMSECIQLERHMRVDERKQSINDHQTDLQGQPHGDKSTSSGH